MDMTNHLSSYSTSITKRALLIEDDEVDLLTLLRSLSDNSESYQCDHACQLSDARDLINTNDYDIIITDMNLPDSTGLETITKLLSMAGEIPIVVLSGSDDEDVALAAVHAGAQDFFPKRYSGDSKLIVRSLRHAIERHQLKLGLERTRDREHFLAHYDQCTGLPNRLLFLDRLQQAVIHSQRQQEQFSLCFLDLDRFKEINDLKGHAAGDEVLRVVGERMQNLLRESDTVARFGGDEFVLILQKTYELTHLRDIARKLIDAINQPISFGRHLCSVGASLGIASYPAHGESSEQLLKHADMAMYEAKNKGRNQLQLFTGELLKKKGRSQNQESLLRDALSNPEAHFTLSYQPRIDLRDGKIHSVEALIRWHHPDAGNIPPDVFIPLAERLGLIEKIDEWVLETACKKMVKWKTIDPSVRIGINLSGRSFNRKNFVSELVGSLFEKYNISGNNLEIEITEGVLLENTQKVHYQLMALKNLGITIAIDDFGTGFSSLNYLNQLPIDTLKIDGSFICDETSNHNEKTVLKAIVALGKALEFKVVAECIETDAQRQYLQKLECHEGQGFFWGKPKADWDPIVP
ncbi:EAL domain-containing protein [bacterium]|nr:EAL domain-containing protein [bacterium]